MMDVTTTVPEPLTAPTQAGEVDFRFLEGQARKMMDKSVRYYKIFQTIGGLTFLLAGLGWTLLYLLLNPIIIYLAFGVGLLSIGAVYLVVFNINSRFMPNKVIRNMKDWITFLGSKEGAAIKNESQGKLEVLMKMVGSMEEWLKAEYNMEGTAVIIPAIALNMSSMVIMNFSHGTGGLSSLLLIIPVMSIVIIIVGLYTANRRYEEKLKLWRPRLGAYRSNFEGYWGRL